MVTAIHDIYDALPPERGAALRRANLERLAELEADGHERRARMLGAATGPTPDPQAPPAPRARSVSSLTRWSGPVE